jgi:hypothetical protein
VVVLHVELLHVGVGDRLGQLARQLGDVAAQLRREVVHDRVHVAVDDGLGVRLDVVAGRYLVHRRSIRCVRIPG